MKLPFGVGAYRRTDTRMPEIICKNQFVEKAPANLGQQIVLLARPGLAASYTVGTGPIRGLYRADGVFDGDKFAVSGTELYREQTLVGAITGSDLVDIDGYDVLYLAAGTLYSYDGTTLSTVAMPDDVGAVSIAVVSEITVIADATGIMYFILPGNTTVDPLSFVSAEAQPDPVIAVRKVGNELWAFGTQTVQPFVTTGDDDAPFSPIEGREYVKGCRSRDTIAILDNTAFWVASDGQVCRAAEQPERISDHGIEERIARVASTDLRAWGFSWNGHAFYVLAIGSEGTFVYDAATSQWWEAQSYGLDHWRAHLGVLDGLSVYVGDSVNGTIGLLDENTLTDYGDPVERRCTAGLKVDRPASVDALELEVATGFADEPIVEARLSRDYGNTWGPWRQMSLGGLGEYRKRVLARRWGLIDGLGVFDIRTTDAAPWRLSGVTVNESSRGGRSR